MTDTAPRGSSNIETNPIYKWLNFGILALLSSLLMGGTMVSLSVYIPALRTAEGWSTTSLGLAATAFLLSFSVAGILGGFLIDRTNPRIALVAGGAISALGVAFASAAPDVTMFILAMAMTGIGLGFATNVTSVPLISASFGDERGKGLGAYFSALALSAASLPPLVSTLITAAGWRSAMQFISGAIILCTALVFIMKIDRSATRMSLIRDDPQALPIKSAQPATRLLWLPVKSAVRTKNFWALTIALSLCLIAVQGVIFSAIAYFVEAGISSFHAVSIFSLANMVGVPAMFLFGIMADKIGARKVLGFGVIVIAVGTAAIIPITAGGLLGWTSAGVFITLWGLSSGLPSQVGPMVLEDCLGPQYFGALLGINTAISSLSGAFAPIITSWIHENSGGYDLAFLILAALALLTLPLLRLVRPNTPESIAQLAGSSSACPRFPMQNQAIDGQVMFKE